MNKEKMIAMGASDAQARALLGNRWFSLTVLTVLVTELEPSGMCGPTRGDRSGRDRPE